MFWNDFPRLTNISDHCFARCAFSFGKEDFQQYAIYFRFNIIGQLIGGHRKQNIALFDGIAFLELPFFNCALCHGQT